MIDRAYGAGQKLLEQLAENPELIEQAKRHAEAALGSFLGALGWTASVSWTLGCQCCAANLEDFRSEQNEAPRMLRQRLMESTAGFFVPGSTRRSHAIE